MTDQTGHPTEPGLPEDVRATLSNPDTWANPPAGLEDDLLDAMRRERDARDEPAPSASDTIVSLNRPAGRQDPARPWRRPAWLLTAAAAAVVVAVVGVGIAVRDGSPDEVVNLRATGLAPGASGEAVLTDTESGFKIELDIEGLEPAAPGTYYQAWLKNDAGDLVTIGTFHGRDGTQDVVLWSGVDPADYPTLTVTVQEEGAGAESSGEVVLTGTLTT